MITVGIGLAIAIIAVAFALVAAKRLDGKHLSLIILAGVVAGFLIANITSIKDLSVKLAGIGEINASLKSLQADVAAVQDGQEEIARVAAETDVAVDRALRPATSSRVSPNVAERVERLGRVAVKDPAARSRWIAELLNR